MDIPSLFMIPSAVSSGKVHSVFPNSTDADFDFNRDSDATRVNSEGLIERVGYYGSELVTNGNFATDSNWTKTSGAEISNGRAKITVTGGGFQSVAQSISLSNTKKYRITAIVNGTSGKAVTFVDNSANNGGLTTSNGVITFNGQDQNVDITWTANTNSGEIEIIRNGSGDFNFTVDNVSVKELIADRARLNYEIDGGLVNTKPSLLLEPQSTNLVASSENLKDSYATTNASVDLNNSISPDGTITANKFNSTALNSSIQKTNANTSATSHTISIFLKKGSIDLVSISILGGIPAISASTTVNLTTGVITASSGNGSITPTITRFSNDWYRVTASSTSNGSVANPTITITNQSTISNGYFYIWGLQFEGLSYATSYIPTNGSTQTRAAETCNGAGTSSILPSEEGILYAEIAALASQVNYRYVALTDGTTNNRVDILYRGDVANKITSRLTVGGAEQARFDIIIDNELNFNKFALSWKQNRVKFFINGTQQGSTDTSANVPSANTFNELMFDRGDGNEQFYGKVRDIRVYNTKEMTDSEVDILLTKITS